MLRFGRTGTRAVVPTILASLLLVVGCSSEPTEPERAEKSGSATPNGSGFQSDDWSKTVRGSDSKQDAVARINEIREAMDSEPVDHDKELEAHAMDLIRTAAANEERGYFGLARKNREELLQISKRLYGNDSWQVISSKKDLEYHDWLVGLKEEQRAELKKARTMERESMEFHSRGEYRNAGNKTTESIKVWQSVGGDAQPHFAALVSLLAHQCQRQGIYDRAEKLHRRALTQLGELYGQNHPEYAAALDNLAVMHQDRGEFEKAEPLLRRAIDIRLQAMGPDHIAYAVGLQNLAALHQDMNNFAEAEKAFRQGIAVFAKKHGTNHPFYATGLRNIAVLYLEQNKLAEAEQVAIKAAEVFKGHDKSRNANYATVLRVQGRIKFAQGKVDEAESLLNEAIKIMKAGIGYNHPSYWKTQLHLGEVNIAQKKFAAAEALLSRSLQSREKMLGSQHPEIAKNLVAYAKLLRATQRDAEAQKFEDRANSIKAARTAAAPSGSLKR